MNHLFVGSLIPFVIGCGIYALKKGRISLVWLIGMPVAMFLGATWAVIPDLPRTFGSIFPNMPFGINWQALDAKMASASNPWIDIFCWHYTINQHENNSILFTLGFIAMLGILFRIGWKMLTATENGLQTEER
jgi:hypothetical protein